MITRNSVEEPNFETTIILNEDKLKGDFYAKEKADALLDDVFASVGMVREGNTFRRGTCAMLGLAVVALLKQEWFMKLVKEWTLSIREDGIITYEENVLESKLAQKKYLNKYGL